MTIESIEKQNGEMGDKMLVCHRKIFAFTYGFDLIYKSDCDPLLVAHKRCFNNGHDMEMKISCSNYRDSMLCAYDVSVRECKLGYNNKGEYVFMEDVNGKKLKLDNTMCVYIKMKLHVGGSDLETYWWARDGNELIIT